VAPPRFSTVQTFDKVEVFAGDYRTDEEIAANLFSLTTEGRKAIAGNTSGADHRLTDARYELVDDAGLRGGRPDPPKCPRP
jgi:hypothetical protein